VSGRGSGRGVGEFRTKCFQHSEGLMAGTGHRSCGHPGGPPYSPKLQRAARARAFGGPTRRLSCAHKDSAPGRYTGLDPTWSSRGPPTLGGPTSTPRSFDAKSGIPAWVSRLGLDDSNTGHHGVVEGTRGTGHRTPDGSPTTNWVRERSARRQRGAAQLVRTPGSPPKVSRQSRSWEKRPGRGRGPRRP